MSNKRKHQINNTESEHCFIKLYVVLGAEAWTKGRAIEDKLIYYPVDIKNKYAYHTCMQEENTLQLKTNKQIKQTDTLLNSSSSNPQNLGSFPVNDLSTKTILFLALAMLMSEDISQLRLVW